MKISDLVDDPYYRDNLYSLLLALRLLGDPANTGDWLNELVAALEINGADPMNANETPGPLALRIYTSATEQPITEIMALIDEGHK